MTRFEAICTFVAIVMNVRPKTPVEFENYIHNVDEAFHALNVTTEELNEAVKVLPLLKMETRLGHSNN